MDQRIPTCLYPLLQDYTFAIQQAASDLVTGCYLVGSLALDGFNPRFSDIDFVATLSRPVVEADYTRLSGIHSMLRQKYPRWPMEGIYLQSGDLGRHEGIPAYPSLHEGKFQPSQHFEMNPITWWLLKNRAITLFGPDSQTLPFMVNWDELIAWMYGNLNTYWVSWTKHPIRIAALLTDFGIQWAVLGVLRQFYSFRENQICTKTNAGAYGLTCLPAHFHPIVQEAIALREAGAHRSRHYLRLARARDALGLLRFVITACNAEKAA